MEDNEPWLGWSLEAIEPAVAAARGDGRALPAIALVGFSQGACIVAEHLARRPEPYGAAAILTGALFGTPDADRMPAGSLDDLPMFFGIAEDDDWIPVDAVRDDRGGLPARRRALRAACLRRPGARDQRRRDRRRPFPAHRPLGALRMTDAFLVGGVRTPFGRYRGALADSRPDDLAALVLGAALERAGVPHDAVDEVIFGAANQAGEDNRNVARMAALLAGLPDEVPGYTVNRLCASSLQAVASAAQQIRSGEADVVVAGGVESMTRAPMVLPKSPRPWAAAGDVADTTLGWRLVNPRFKDLDGGKATISLGETAEEVAVLDGISREDSDAWGLRSQQLTAEHSDRLALDFVPVETAKAEVTEDEVPRADTSAEALAKLKPAFKADGIVTAGTASPLSDGASAIVVASGEARRAPRPHPARADRGLGLGRRAAAHHGAGPRPVDARRSSRAAAGRSPTSTPSRSTRRSRPRSSRASAAWASTPRPSTPTAARSRSATRSARRAYGSCSGS